MPTVDVAPLVTPTYTPTLLVPTDGSTFTQALLTNLIVGLANRTEFLRDLSAEASDTPEAYCTLRDDFFGAVDSISPGTLQSDIQWRRSDEGSPAINHRAGSSKNPGLLEVSLPGNGTDFHEFEIHIGSATGAPFSYATFQELVVVVKVEEDVSNITEWASFGLVDNAGLQNGGDDCLVIARQKASSATKWLLMRRVGGSQVTTALAAADFDNAEFAVWRMVRIASGDFELYLNGTLVHTVAAADVPTGGCNLTCNASVTAADTEVFTVSWDLVVLRTKPNDRSGA
jgi:hypothetical protein